MILEPLYSLNEFKYAANRHLATKEGYQWYDIDTKKKTLIPFEKTKLDVKRKLIEPIIDKLAFNKTILDLGCDKGYFSWYCMKAGASRVVANDVNDQIHDYLTFLCKVMRWDKIEPLKSNLFSSNESFRFNYVLSLAMIHEVKNCEHKKVIQKIRDMAIDGALIEFCEDYQYKFGSSWNNKWFESALNKYFNKIELVGTYDAIAEKGGKRYIYDCSCN
jgi:2-polyprenyl-3-methyl-5-hydroxy-6-metoxy-1,4-benzoquinol methylase